MTTLIRSRLSSLDGSTSDTFSTEFSEDKPSTIQTKKERKSKRTGSYKRSNSSTASYIIDYGPIRVRHRRSISQTLATGRRSRDDPVNGEDALKRELRRAKNRISARELKRSRDKIELDLIQKIKELEDEKNCLEDQRKTLEDRKVQLNRAVYNAKQTPLVPLVTDINIPVLYEVQQRQDLLIDLQPLLKTIDEHFCLYD